MQSQSDQWPKRLYILDVSRGFAALAVVFWHWQHFAFKGDTLPTNFDQSTQPWYGAFRLLYESGWTGVNYFFLLSGFIFFWLYHEPIRNRTVGTGTFVMQRLSRLYPLHLVTLVAVAVLQMVYTGLEGGSFVYPYNDTYHFVLNLGFAGYWGFEEGRSFNDPIWSVSIEVLLYASFFVVALLRRGSWSFCLLVALGSFLFYRLVPHPLWLGLAMFFVGGAVYTFTRRLTDDWQRLKPAMHALTIGGWVGVLVSFYLYDFTNLMSEYTVGMLFLKGFRDFILFPATVCSFALLEIDRGPFLKRIAWVGNITYSSYLLHFPLQLLFALAVSYGLLHADFWLQPFYLVLFFLILVPMSYLTFEYFERPMQRMIRNRYDKRRKPAESAAQKPAPRAPELPAPALRFQKWEVERGVLAGRSR